MATKEAMMAEISGYFNKCVNLFARSRGNKDDMLFVDNPTGQFSFVSGPVVEYLQIATTTAEATNARSVISANTALYGLTFVNQFTLSIETWNPTTSAWTTTTANYSSAMKAERVYYSSWSKRIWVGTTYGAFKRFLTTGMTPVG